MMAMVMALSVTAVAFAETVTNNTTHSYNAYQIFSGTQSEDGAELGDAQWGTGVDGAALLAELKTDARFNVGADGTNIFASCATALDVAAVLGNYVDKSDVAKAFANVAAKHLTSTYTEIAAGATEVTLDSGYYLLVDTTEPVDGDAKNPALLQVTNKGDITIEKKYASPLPTRPSRIATARGARLPTGRSAPTPPSGLPAPCPPTSTITRPTRTCSTTR